MLVFLHMIFSSIFCRRSANDCFDLQPSWFDTLLPSDIGCVDINNYPIRTNDLDAKDTEDSFYKPLKPEHSKAAKGMEGFFWGNLKHGLSVRPMTEKKDFSQFRNWLDGGVSGIQVFKAYIVNGFNIFTLRRSKMIQVLSLQICSNSSPFLPHQPRTAILKVLFWAMIHS